MKKYLLFSDTHGREENLIRVLEDEGPFYGCFFCGDGEGLENRTFSIAGFPPVVNMVKGNNDWGSDLPGEAVTGIGSSRIFMTHGHRFGVSHGLSVLSAAARARDCDFCFFGHTHRQCFEYCDGVLMVNPGSLSEPRGSAPGYAVIQASEDGQLDITLKTLPYRE